MCNVRGRLLEICGRGTRNFLCILVEGVRRSFAARLMSVPKTWDLGSRSMWTKKLEGWEKLKTYENGRSLGEFLNALCLNQRCFFTIFPSVSWNLFFSSLALVILYAFSKTREKCWYTDTSSDTNLVIKLWEEMCMIRKATVMVACFI